MGELDVQQPPIVSPARPGGPRGQRPFRWPGYPDDGRLTAAEANRGPLFGTDTPYYVTPSGFGEYVPVVGDTSTVVDLLVYDPATGKVEAQPR